MDFCERLRTSGRLMGAGPHNQLTSRDAKLHECLAGEAVAAFLPLEDLGAATSSYSHLRAAAAVICSSALLHPLPPEWEDLHASDITASDGTPYRTLPRCLRENMAYTNVSFRDPNVDAKVFVRQHPYGTGSYRSTVDCVTSRSSFRQHRFWSLDGLFLDNVDPEWLFWQRESEIKWKLYGDYFGRARAVATDADVPPRSGAELYSKQRFARRIGLLVPESPQALTRTKFDWLEMAREENLGPPASMTTVVANVRTSTILAHIEGGPFARPDPEATVRILMPGASPYNTTQHAGIQTADYLRRRRDFETYAYRQGYDTHRGRFGDTTRRREQQMRGFNHDHFCEFPEPCGLPISFGWEHSCSHRVSGPGSSSQSSLQLSFDAGCRSVSRWCLRADSHCRLPPQCDGTPLHMSHHLAYVSAELTRPFPLGSISRNPSQVPKLDASTMSSAQNELDQIFWSTRRLLPLRLRLTLTTGDSSLCPLLLSSSVFLLSCA